MVDCRKREEGVKYDVTHDNATTYNRRDNSNYITLRHRCPCHSGSNHHRTGTCYPGLSQHQEDSKEAGREAGLGLGLALAKEGKQEDEKPFPELIPKMTKRTPSIFIVPTKTNGERH